MKRHSPKRKAFPVIAGRVSPSLHRQIKEAAKKSGRSMSEELVWRAAKSFESNMSDIQKTVSATIVELQKLGFVGPHPDDVAKAIREYNSKT